MWTARALINALSSEYAFGALKDRGQRQWPDALPGECLVPSPHPVAVSDSIFRLTACLLAQAHGWPHMPLCLCLCLGLHLAAGADREAEACYPPVMCILVNGVSFLICLIWW